MAASNNYDLMNAEGSEMTNQAESSETSRFQGLDYKTMIGILKANMKEADSMLDKVSELSIKFGEHLTTLTTIVDPEANAILFRKMPGFDLDAVDEQFPIPKEEVESRYEKLCEMLDNETEKQLSNQQETSANLASSVADVNRTGASKE
ncbi:uncharacterized protein LOC110843141 isoform X2 [Folsomia candida]|uniref:Uncharacterized protein n=2 Tax=Folsomia candida TaxID=158441 RepID=A0A226EU82_FOLCA|nr:uncharacterized protein LOC110843141 isoform X2 [Folsomia candida]OXA60707.1 hypothetical protein Fcan01_05842 [Folsomia candida]